MTYLIQLYVPGYGRVTFDAVQANYFNEAAGRVLDIIRDMGGIRVIRVIENE